MNNASVDCLTGLVGTRTCNPTTLPPFVIEDLEGVDMTDLAAIATPTEGNGKTVLQNMINSAAKEFLTDLEMLVTNGFINKSPFGEICSLCDFTSIRQPGGGVKVENITGSKYSKIVITRIDMLAAATGDKILVIDDGVTLKRYTVTLVDTFTIIPLTLKYETFEKSVDIYFEDNTIGAAQIICQNNGGGCGCGGRKSQVDYAVKFTGSLFGMDSVTQYGFKVCASVVCSNDIIICELVRQVPNMIGITFLYKIGARYYSDARLSKRNNRVAAQDEDKKVNMQQYYLKLYTQRLNGTPDIKGLSRVLSDYLKANKDKCITCEALVRTAYVTG